MTILKNINREQECPLCRSHNTDFYFEDKKRTYLKCGNCFLIFVHAMFLLDPEEEKERYHLHENNPDDPKYRNYLNRLFKPMIKHISPGSSGLDFGSGPGPTLSVMFEEAGFRMEIFDYFFSDNKSVLNRNYDFITASEVFEHLYKPGKEIEILWNILKPGGCLGIMTGLADGKDNFKSWHYITDPTHVSFFSIETFEWIAEKLGTNPEFHGNNVIILKKNTDQIKRLS